MALSQQEIKAIRRGMGQLQQRSSYDDRCLAYYEGRQSLAHLGLAVPKELAQLEMVVNWPRVVVDTIEEREDVRDYSVAGAAETEETLRSISDANDLDSELSMWKRDRLIYGRGFLIVDVPESNEYPAVRIGSPRETTVIVDRVRRTVSYAVQIMRYGDQGERVAATLYTPTYTVAAEIRQGTWVETFRSEHGLDVVPVIPSFNRRMTGEWIGHSEMEDVSQITDATVRALTDLQVAVETNAVPKRIIFGGKKADFDSLDGWFNYLKPFTNISDTSAKALQLDAASLTNFHDTIELYGKLAASVTGFPARYFGLITTNPPAEGAIRAEESKLVKRVERVNAEAGGALSRAMTLAARLAGRDVHFGAINVRWHDPATPTFSQKSDALQKLAGGKAILSREGVWDELGWDETRKEAERRAFERELYDPTIDLLSAKVDGAYGPDA